MRRWVWLASLAMVTLVTVQPIDAKCVSELADDYQQAANIDNSGSVGRRGSRASSISWSPRGSCW